MFWTNKLDFENCLSDAKDYIANITYRNTNIKNIEFIILIIFL